MNAYHLVVFGLWLAHKVSDPVIAVYNVLNLIFKSQNTQDSQRVLLQCQGGATTARALTYWLECIRECPDTDLGSVNILE